MQDCAGQVCYEEGRRDDGTRKGSASSPQGAQFTAYLSCEAVKVKSKPFHRPFWAAVGTPHPRSYPTPTPTPTLARALWLPCEPNALKLIDDRVLSLEFPGWPSLV